MILLNLS